ncbi:MAG: amino acid ABC transporter permease [Anaerolineae bacterium]|nr:amino acid ABC transporter permease [Anaerolineae bacterium]
MDERTRTEQSQPIHLPPPDESGDGLTPPGPYERIINWLAGLPWWALILGVVAVAVLYSMLTSEAYRRVIQSLTDNPQSSTEDLYNVVQIVGEPTMIVGRYAGETQDSVTTVVDELLDTVIGTSQVTRTGFLLAEDPASITLRTDGGLVTIPKDRIVDEQREMVGGNEQITLTYIERVTVSGTLTKRTDKTMTIRTVNEAAQTFAVSRVLSRTVIPCTQVNAPGCEEGEYVTIERQGEIVTGTLNTLSNTNLSLSLPDGNTREIRRSDIDRFDVPTLTVALNARSAARSIVPDDEVRIAFVLDTDIMKALDELETLDDVPVPLRYADGQSRVVLIGYGTLDEALAATGAGEADALLYLDDGPDRRYVETWVEDNPRAGVALPTPPRECQKGCKVTVKLNDDVLTGRIEWETDDEIRLVTTEAQYIDLDRSKIVENRRMEPGACALNNLRGCNAGIFLTLRVTFQAYGLALLIGLFFGLLRVQTNPVLYAVSTLYVEVVRGIPLLVILLYAGFVVSPQIRDTFGVNLSDEQEAVLGLAFGYGAFIAEIFRAGIQSISRGQMEAARSLGMSYPQGMRFVVLPQAVRVVLPPLGNDFIAMLKDSALISVLALPDLLQLGRLYVSRTFRAFEGYNTVAILYLLMTLFLSMVVRIIERRTRLPH